MYEYTQRVPRRDIIYLIFLIINTLNSKNKNFTKKNTK